MIARSSAYLALLVALLACALTPPLPASPTPAPPAAVASPPPTPAVTPTIVADSGWQTLGPGLERRVVNQVTGQGSLLESLTILRLEPALFNFTVAYQPGQPLTLEQWSSQSGALLVVNGGYFTEENYATGLIVAEGQRSGQSYGDFAGMFAVTADGVELRWLLERPYDPAEPLLAAIQSFPLLVKPGGQLGFPEEDGLSSRRTVVAQDTQGRILFLLAPRGALTLHQLSRFLVDSDLAIDVALNLDGGTSTGMILTDPAETVPAYVALPAVIAVYRR
jgi:uncharacterized protein YigE (DUF2233 family)